MPPMDDDTPAAPSIGTQNDTPAPEREAEPPAPFLGVAVAALGLLMAAPGLLAILLLGLRGDAAPTWLWLLHGAALALCYGGLWRVLAASTPTAVLRGLALGLAAILGAAWGLGAPGWMLALALVVVAALLLLTSGPILFHAWVERTDAQARRRSQR